jgi:hypothetical protein
LGQSISRRSTTGQSEPNALTQRNLHRESSDSRAEDGRHRGSRRAGEPVLAAARALFGDCEGLRADYRVDAAGSDGCWTWLGALRSGYGIAKRSGRILAVHRAALSMRLGRDLGRDEVACHRCDNRACVNPDHLFAGSLSDNMRDASSKGRLDKKLAVEEVRLIQAMSGRGITEEEIARKFRVHPDSIRRVLHREQERRSA